MSDSLADPSPRPWHVERRKPGDVLVRVYAPRLGRNQDQTVGEFLDDADARLTVTAVNERDALLADRDRLAAQVEAVKALATAKGRETWSTVSEYDRGYRDGRTDAFAEVTTTIRALEGES